MLGRLFNKNAEHDAHEKPPSPAPTSNDTSYTREILYGSADKRLTTPYKLNSKFFRILVSQDGGSLRSKQVLFDSANNEILTKLSSNATTNKISSKNILTPKIHHNANELNDYMFGCGLPTKESQAVTKIHFLPVVNNQTYGSYKSVLLTRLFSITDYECSENDSSWVPKPVLPIRDNKITVSNGPSDDKNSLNSRFAIGLIIPLENDKFSEIIANNWEELSHYLIILQKIVHKKLIGIINNNDSGSSYIVSRRIQLPVSILQQDFELNNYLIKLIKLVNYDSNIPRLINSNSLMRVSLENSSSRFNPMLINWVLEVLNWNEFKESKQIDSQKFLSSLFALILPHRASLSQKPLHYDHNSNSKEITRVVVMTGNPVVAKKLLFIINGLIEDPNVLDTLNHYEYDEDAIMDDDEVETDVDSVNDIATLSSLGSPTNFSTVASPLNSTSIIHEDTDDEDPTLSAFSSPSPRNAGSQIKPIPIKSSSTMSAGSSSENSYSQSVASKGWEIPGKSTPVTSTSFSKTKIIPINQQPVHRASVSKSSSMAYLSSSLNSSSLSSSASNYSLSKLGGSFIEKWRNSFNSSMSNYDTEYHPPSGSLSKKSSIQTLRTPSPALEIEEFNWNSSPNKLSRTQSMYDLYNNSFDRADVRKSLGNVINRTKTGIHNNSRKNKEVVRRRCEKIMNAHISVKSHDGVLEVAEMADEQALNRETPLLPSVAFCDEFRPEFLVQSCPLNPKLEQQVIGAMKNDLLFFQNNCKTANITTRTIFISLRVREIKVMEMKVGGAVSCPPSQAPTPAATSPGGYFSQAPSASAPQTPSEAVRRPSASYKTSIRKVFTPQKNAGDKAYIQMIENVLREINNLFVVNYNRQHQDGQLDGAFTERLKSLVEALTHK